MSPRCDFGVAKRRRGRQSRSWLHLLELHRVRPRSVRRPRHHGHPRPGSARQLWNGLRGMRPLQGARPSDPGAAGRRWGPV